MQSEARLLLQDFISDPHNYVAILTAIANGARTPKEIEASTGLPNVQVPKYLSVLAEAGFVERKIPVTGSPKSRSGKHQLVDPFLRFYYRFLASRQEQIALGIQDQALAEISRHMIDFIGTHTWEELCREWTLRAGGKGEIPFLPDQVGSAWNTNTQIDVAGINRMGKILILGECKWGQTASERPVLSSLIGLHALSRPRENGKSTFSVFPEAVGRTGRMIIERKWNERRHPGKTGDQLACACWTRNRLTGIWKVGLTRLLWDYRILRDVVII
jgi:AAA+ ATPase superfamily predicted ATPase